MRRLIGASVLITALTMTAGPARADGFGPPTTSGDLVCSSDTWSATYTVQSAGVGDAWRVIGTTQVLVFRSGTLSGPLGTFTFGPYGEKNGITPVHCVGDLYDYARDITSHADFYMSVKPGA